MEEKYKEIRTEDPDIGEKHVPVVKVEEKDGEVVIDVVVGDTEHPSEPGHFIQWIEVLDNDVSLSRIYLSLFIKPRVTFILKEKPEKLVVREFCNLHGEWQYSE